jgi:hypothetical protein
MHDVNPLGPLMHLKELERQAARTSSSIRSTRANASVFGVFSRLVISFLNGSRPSAAQGARERLEPRPLRPSSRVSEACQAR